MAAKVKVNNLKSSKPLSGLGIRHVQIALLFTGLVFSFNVRVNMSIAIVAMTDSKDESGFDWSMQKQSIILSAFFWGYAVVQSISGVLSSKFGGSILVTIAIAANAVISFFIPLAAHYGGWQTVCACRIGQGVTQAFLYPSIHHLIGKWIPIEEKSRSGFFIYGGAQVGTVMQLVLSGYIIDYWGWPGVFYVNGSLGAIWVIVYIMLRAESPQESKMISNEEKMYIQTSLGQVGEQKKIKTPWKSILTSLPFYALIVAQSGHLWGQWTLMTEMPSFMKQILGVNIVANGIMSALPYLAMYLLGFPVSFISDYVLTKKWVSVTTARKTCQTIGEWGAGFALIGLCYVPPGNVTLGVALLTVVVGLNAGHYCGFMLVHIDMAPNFAGDLMAIAGFVSNIFSLMAPLVAGLILQDESDPSQWRQVFFLSSAIYISSNLFFLIFGSSERQQWNDLKDIDEGREETAVKVGSSG